MSKYKHSDCTCDLDFHSGDCPLTGYSLKNQTRGSLFVDPDEPGIVLQMLMEPDSLGNTFRQVADCVSGAFAQALIKGMEG